MPPEDRDRFTKAIAALGWGVRMEGETVIAEGGGTTLTVWGNGNCSGLEELRLRLTREVERREARLGRSVLVVGPGREATWTFEPERK
jgi:hypothetical protein